MAKRLQLKRLGWLAAALAIAFGGLAYRLVVLQVIRHDTLAQKADENTRREMVIEPRRGDILDARGNLLATSVLVKKVCADPSLMGGRAADVARVLAPLLQLGESELTQKLQLRWHTNKTGQAVPDQYVCL